MLHTREGTQAALRGAGRGARAGGRRWRVRAGIAVLIGLYLAVWGVVALLPLTGTDLDAFYFPAARDVLDGHLLTVYQLRVEEIYPYANGPLGLAPMTLAAWLARYLGWLDDMALRRMLALTIGAVSPLLMAWEGVRAVDRLRGPALTGIWRVLAYAALALSPQVWHSMLFYGHIEQPLMLWLALAGIRMLLNRRALVAGALFGLALLTRTSSVLLIIPLALLLLRERDVAALGKLLGALLAVVAAGIIPFVVADRTDVVYSLVTFRGGLPVGGGSLLGLAIGTPLEPAAQRWDGALVLAASVTLSAVLLFVRRDLTLGSRDLYLWLALSALSFPLLLKTMWPYYFLDPFLFLAIWWMARLAPGRIRWWLWVLLPLAPILLAQAGEVGLTLLSTRPVAVRPWSLVMAIGMTALAGVILWRLLARYNADERAPSIAV